MPTPARRPAAGQRARRRPPPGRRPLEPPARGGAARRAAPLRRAARRPRRAGAQHPVEPAQGARGRGPAGRPALLRAAPPGRLRAHRQRRRAGRRAAAARPVGRGALDRDRARRCTTPRAAPPWRRAGGAPPAPAWSTTTRTPTSTGCDLSVVVGWTWSACWAGREDVDLAAALVVVEAAVGRLDELVARPAVVGRAGHAVAGADLAERGRVGLERGGDPLEDAGRRRRGRRRRGSGRTRRRRRDRPRRTRARCARGCG